MSDRSASPRRIMIPYVPDPTRLQRWICVHEALVPLLEAALRTQVDVVTWGEELWPAYGLFRDRARALKALSELGALVGVACEEGVPTLELVERAVALLRAAKEGG